MASVCARSSANVGGPHTGCSFSMNLTSTPSLVTRQPILRASSTEETWLGLGLGLEFRVRVRVRVRARIRVRVRVIAN